MSEETEIKQKMPLIGIDPTGIQPRQQCWEMVHHQLRDDGCSRNEFCILKFLTHLHSFRANACGSLLEEVPMFKNSGDALFTAL